MKNIVLIGASRSGKSTFTKIINSKLNNIMIIRTDLLRLAFRKSIYKDEKISTSIVAKDQDYKNFVLNYYNFANMYDTDFIKIVDTVDFEPKDHNKFKNAIIICFGYPNISAKEVVDNFRKYDTDLDWTKNKDDECLLKFAEEEIKKSKYLKQECIKYNILFIDTSHNREKVLNDLIKNILKKD